MTVSIVVEDGTQVVGANSYASVADLQTYATNRAVTISATDPGTLLLQATDYFESLDYKGYRIANAQSLKWPRSYVYFDRFPVSSTTIHTRLKNAFMETALAIDAGNGPMIDVPRKIDEVSVAGAVTVKYARGAASVVINRKIMNMLAPFLQNGSINGWGFQVSR